MKAKEYYKVVCVTGDGRRVSCIMGLRDDIGLEYKEGEWIKPKVANSKIMVFETEQEAGSFAEFEYSNYVSKEREIWKVKGWGKAEPVRYLVNSRESLDKFVSHWLLKLVGLKAPDGTLGLSKVKLIERVREVSDDQSR